MQLCNKYFAYSTLICALFCLQYADNDNNECLTRITSISAIRRSVDAHAIVDRNTGPTISICRFINKDFRWIRAKS